jgi:hypothetical protein
MVKVPINAHLTLVEGEFNRFYMRGLCLRAVEEDKTTVTAYRAKHAQNPRSESLAIEVRSFNAEAALSDLRANVGSATAAAFPGPNSGLSVRL